jgi:membrane fusion protein, multidrug efflux system
MPVRPRFQRAAPPIRRRASLGSLCVAAAILSLLVTACDKKKAEEPDIRPVWTVSVASGDGKELTTLTGEICARYESDLGFRIDGKIIDRPIDIGSTVKKGDLLARLHPQPRQQDLQQAKAGATAAQARLAKDQAVEARQTQLLKDGSRPAGSAASVAAASCHRFLF